MKTMTCKQMGGPCDAPVQGNTADEMMANGAIHVNEMAAKGDEAHKKVQEMMLEMQKNPASGEEWNKNFAAAYAASPDN